MSTGVPAIKFCGLTRVADVECACALGVDYIGLVFAHGSPRHLDLDRARELAAVLRTSTQPQRPRLVALLRDASAVDVRAVITRIQPNVLQFHGSEDEAFCQQFALPYWKALGLLGVADAQALVERSHPSADALLLDAHVPGAAGGTGDALDWTRWPRTARRLLLAGGLTAENVAGAVQLTRPFAVDVSSGIESAPGIKDAGRMRAFVAAVESARGR